MPASSRNVDASSTCPEASNPRSATNSVRRKPSSRASGPNRVMAPSPKISLALGWNSKPMRNLAQRRLKGGCRQDCLPHNMQKWADVTEQGLAHAAGLFVCQGYQLVAVHDEQRAIG